MVMFEGSMEQGGQATGYAVAREKGGRVRQNEGNGMNEDTI